MSTAASVLSDLWVDLREKSRVRVEHPDLPTDLSDVAGDLIGILLRAGEGLRARRADGAAGRSRSLLQIAREPFPRFFQVELACGHCLTDGEWYISLP
jgi:hypothetical protein